MLQREMTAERRRFTVAVVAREVLRDAAVALGAAQIPVMPLKGVLFQQVLYRDPAERRMSDVDVLVPPCDFPRALRALEAAGFRPQSIGRSLIEVALMSPRGLALDVHRSLFGECRYALSTEAVFRRSTRDQDLFGVPVCLAHPHDTAAHLIGKLVSDHVVTEASQRLTELSRWVRHASIDPVELGRHLQSSGLGRAARYTFELGCELLDEPFFPAALSGLPVDRVGSACAALARSLMPRWQGTPWAAAPAHLLNASLGRAGRSVVATVVNRLRHARLTAGGEMRLDGAFQ